MAVESVHDDQTMSVTVSPLLLENTIVLGFAPVHVPIAATVEGGGACEALGSGTSADPVVTAARGS
jgi:hypothetical protein